MFWNGRTAIEGLSGRAKDRLGHGWRGWRCGLRRRRRLRLCGNAHFERIDPHRLDDVLELGLAEVADREIEPRSHLAIGVFGEADGAGHGDALEPRCDIDAVAHQVTVALLDDIAEMDADAELDPAIRRQAGIALDHAILHLDGAAHGVDDAAELHQRPVAGALHDASLVHGDGGIDQVAAQRPQPCQSPILVRACQPAVADDIGGQDGREFPRLCHPNSSPCGAKLAQEPQPGRDFPPAERRFGLS